MDLVPKYKFYQKGKLPPKNLEAPNIIAATTAITPTTFTQGHKTTFAIIFYFLNVTNKYCFIFFLLTYFVFVYFSVKNYVNNYNN